MKTLLASAILFSALALSRAEMQSPIPLWPDGAPGALGTNANDIPTLTPYLPDATTPPACRVKAKRRRAPRL